ncbi:two component transcriptional regulator [Caballeronia arationis]|uniref:response regulator transcription factor n=1 Tax=Caballeronia arationis TaxID=1777142 RepID=UPI00074B9EFA|nr:response regulator transcription factor [Caballeronia arationis]SAL07642.1 two component transcriptional regulator [Caballeronia arationis]
MLREHGSKLSVLLLADNDWQFGETLCAALEDRFCLVYRVTRNLQLLDALEAHRYDVILLDVDPPKTDCLDVGRILRSQAHCAAVIFIAAEGDFTDGAMSGFRSLADDRLSKPFEISDLLSRMHDAIQRRSPGRTSEMTNGYLWLDLFKGQARSRAMAMAACLTRDELSLLHALMVRPGAILSRKDLQLRIDRSDNATDECTIDAMVNSLRSKLGNEAIREVRGLGWMVPRRL